MISEVSVIVPVAPTEALWPRLLAQLARWAPECCEVLISGPRASSAEALAATAAMHPLKAVAWVEAPLGRARQMNAGARAARGRHLWFLHADSGFSRPDVEALATALREAPRALHYFNLAFDGRPRQLMYLNQAGAWWRSHALGLPFGDQGFCLERDAFFALGGYDEQAAYGEDHLLVWQARRAGIEVRCTRGRIVTSARKYREQGWLRTTILHQYLTYRQAAPELFKSWARKP